MFKLDGKATYSSLGLISKLLLHNMNGNCPLFCEQVLSCLLTLSQRTENFDHLDQLTILVYRQLHQTGSLMDLSQKAKLSGRILAIILSERN